VLDCFDADLTDRVAALVRKVMEKRAIARSVGVDDDLRAGGLSSLDLVNLMLSVESDFSLNIPERDMTPANFRSISRIVDLVRNCQHSALAG
jgi:acyl carrier protein